MIAATTPKEERIGATYLCYCTISLFLADVAGVKAQGGQYSAGREGRSGTTYARWGINHRGLTRRGAPVSDRLHGLNLPLVAARGVLSMAGEGTMAGGTRYNGADSGKKHRHNVWQKSRSL